MGKLQTVWFVGAKNRIKRTDRDYAQQKGYRLVSRPWDDGLADTVDIIYYPLITESNPDKITAKIRRIKDCFPEVRQIFIVTGYWDVPTVWQAIRATGGQEIAMECYDLRSQLVSLPNLTNI